MHKFTDRTGQEWDIDLNLATVRRVKDDWNLYDHTLAQKLDEDDLEFFALLYELTHTCDEDKSQAFAERLDAPTLYAAKVAFFDEWRSFFQQGGRPEKAAGIEEYRKNIAAAMKTAVEEIRKMSAIAEKKTSDKLRTVFGDAAATLDSALENALGERFTKKGTSTPSSPQPAMTAGS